MKLGTEIAWHDPKFSIPVERIKLVERLGYDMVFTAEGSGSDALTPLGYVLGITERIGVGTCVANIWGRTPTALAMGFQTLAAMAGERTVTAGLGASQSTSVEAWHGVHWSRPGSRMRDTVAVMRRAFRGDEPVSYEGRTLSVPYRGEGALRVAPQPPLLETRPDLPIYVGAGGARSIELAAEIGDGWMPLGFALGMMDVYAPMLEAGFGRAPGPKTMDSFDIWVHLDVVVADDVHAAMRPFKEFTARYAGGWPVTANSPNLYKLQMVWSGFAKEQQRVEELWAAGRHDEAADAVPDEYVDDRFLVGPLERVRERARLWRDSGATGLIVRPSQRVGAGDQPEIYEAVAAGVGR